MAANIDDKELRDCVAQIGWNICQCNAIFREGFKSLEALREMLLKHVSNVCSTISKLAANHGEVCIGYALVRRLTGFLWWIKDHQCHRQVANIDWYLAS